MNGELTITSGALAMFILEAIKWAWRTYKKEPEFDFPVKFYAVSLAVLNVLLIPGLAFLGVSNYTMPTDWAGYAKYVVQVFLASLISVGGYETVVYPMKQYNKTRKALLTK